MLSYDDVAISMKIGCYVNLCKWVGNTGLGFESG